MESKNDSPQLCRVLGFGSENEILYLCRSDAEKHLLFLPGDIQDFEEDMKRNGDEDWIDYSLEKTVRMLYDRFDSQKCNVFVTRPERKMGNSSEFDHHLRPGKGTLHLRGIVNSVVEHIQKQYHYEYDERLPIILAGFSKGTLVLHHFLAELATALECDSQDKPKFIHDWEAMEKDYTIPVYLSPLRIARTQTLTWQVAENKEEIFDFASRLTAVHWIDPHRFPTNPPVIRVAFSFLASQQTRLCFHSTNRQLADPRRKYIRKEYDLFLELIKQEQVESMLKMELCLADAPADLTTHFRLLTVFSID